MKVRIALREEGTFWNAYLALSDSMDGAKLIGSIMMGAVRKDADIKAAFQLLMKQVLANAVEEVTGSPPDKWEIMPAPESERAGHS